MNEKDTEIKNERMKWLRENYKGHYDYALPQPWVDSFHKRTGFNPVGHVVWLYDEEARIFGRPYGLTLAADRLLGNE